MSSIRIADLNACPQFLDTAANRIFNAWWRASGLKQDDIARRLREIMATGGPIFSLIAHQDTSFVGTTSVIPADLEARPEFSPWVAAVWVDEPFRCAGIGSRLVDAAAHRAFTAGVSTLYLCARPARAPFYERLGWTPLETAVGPDALTVFTREPAAMRDA